MKHEFVMITDSRLGRDTNWKIATPDPALTGRGWTRGLDLPAMHYAARVNPTAGSASLPIKAEVTPLPYFVGLRGFIAKSPRLLLQIWQLIGRSGVVVTRLPGLIGTLTVVAATLRGRPVALEVVGDPLDAMAGGKRRDRILAAGAATVTTWGVRQARAVRYVTQQTLQRAYPPHKTATAVAFSSVQADRWFKKAPGRESFSPTIIAVGSQQQLYKGHDLLIDAMPQVISKFPTARLVLVGDGKFNEILRRQALAIGVASAIDFVGHVQDKDELISLVDRAWIYAMPSRAEGLPRALVEAMARSKCCVATRVGGISELLDEQQLIDTNDTVQLADGICRFLGDAQLRAELGARNRRSLSAYEPEVLAARSAEWTRAVSQLRR